MAQGIGSGSSVEQEKLAGGTKKLGSILINSSQAVTWGQFEYLIVNEDVTFTTLTTEKDRNLLLGHNDPDGSGGCNLAGISLTRGMFIFAPEYELIRDITVSVGSVMAYG